MGLFSHGGPKACLRAAVLLWIGPAAPVLVWADSAAPLLSPAPAAQDVGTIGQGDAPGEEALPAGFAAQDAPGRPSLIASFLRPFAVATRPFRQLMTATLRRQAMILPSARHLPAHLRHREHWDYPLAFQWVPRSWTSFGWGRPRMILGNQDDEKHDSPKPIGERASFQISRYPDLPAPFCWLPLYVAFTTPAGLHFRLGARWDDVDYYTQFPSVAIKKVKDNK